MILRFLLIGDGVVLVVVGALCVLFVDGATGKVLACGAWLLAGLLFGGVPFTNPYRGHRW